MVRDATIIRAKTKYLDEDAHLNVARYADGSTAWQLYSMQGEPLMTPTVCLMEYGHTPAEGHVIIKDYSENEGILNCLIEQGIISEEVHALEATHVTFYECKVLIPTLLAPRG